jgi:SOS-response transcriptional repressor LexA
MAGVVSEIYNDLMRFKPDGVSPNAWAMKAGVSRTVWADMRRHGNPSRRTLEKLLTAAGSSLAEFEALRVGGSRQAPLGATIVSDRASGWGRAELPSLPLVATAMGGEWKNPQSGIDLIEVSPARLVGRVSRPASLANDHGAYAITILGDSMWPRFRPGRRVAVSSSAPVSLGDDVLVKLKSGQDDTVAVLVKELVRRSGETVVLRQFNPDRTFDVSTADISAIEKVLGELI